MDERLGNNEDLQDILNDIDDITEEKEESVDLFGKISGHQPPFAKQHSKSHGKKQRRGGIQ